MPNKTRQARAQTKRTEKNSAEQMSYIQILPHIARRLSRSSGKQITTDRARTCLFSVRICACVCVFFCVVHRMCVTQNAQRTHNVCSDGIGVLTVGERARARGTMCCCVANQHARTHANACKHCGARTFERSGQTVRACARFACVCACVCAPGGHIILAKPTTASSQTANSQQPTQQPR